MKKLFLILSLLYFTLLLYPQTTFATENFNQFQSQINLANPIGCNPSANGLQCPLDLINKVPSYLCAKDLTEFLKDKNPVNTHYWVEDPDVTAQGQANDRARQFLYWTLNRSALDEQPVLRDIWKVSSGVALFFVILASSLFGIGFIVSRKTNFQLNIKVGPTILKIIMMLLYVLFSASIVLLLIQLSEILTQFFISNLGGKDLFNIYFATSSGTSSAAANIGGSEQNYTQFFGCRDLNIRVQESIKTEIFMLKLTNITYYLMGVMIILRKILLWFLLFVSPFLAILMPFVFIRNIGWIWIGVFFQWLFYGPLFALFLGALNQIWKNGIPFQFDFSRVNTAAGYIYPTAINITYGGPAQINSALANHSIGPLNSGNYVDTFAEYIVTLIMLWAVIFFPWWLLRIFRDYCCDGIYAMKNILLSLYDEMRNGPPNGPKPSPVMSNFPSFKTDMNMSKDTDIKVNVQMSNLENIKRVQTVDISKTLNLSATKLTDIAHMEMNKTTQQTVIKNLANLSNPIKAQTPVERQQFMNLRTELFSRAIKNDTIARTLLSSTSTSQVEKTRQREELLRTMPISVSVAQAAVSQTNIPIAKVSSITSQYMQGLSNQSTIVNNISNITKVSNAQVKDILNTYTQNISKSAPQIIKVIATKTNTSESKVKEVLRLSNSFVTQSNLLRQTATKEQINTNSIAQVLQSISRSTETTLVTLGSGPASLPPQQTAQTVQSLVTNNEFLQTVQNKTSLAPPIIQQAITTYAQHSSESRESIINNIAQTTNISKENATTVVNNVSEKLTKIIQTTQQSQAVQSLTNNTTFVQSVQNQTGLNQTTVKQALETYSQHATDSKESIINNIAQTTNISKENATTVVNNVSEKLTKITQANQQSQTIQNTQSTVQSLANNSSFIQNVQNTTGVTQSTVQQAISTYTQHVNESKESIVNNIAKITNVNTEVANKLVNEISQKVTEVTQNQAQTQNVTNVAETKEPMIKIISFTAKMPEAKAQSVTTTVMNSMAQNQATVQNIQNKTGLQAQQVKNVLTTYAQNISQPSQVITDRISQSAGVTKEKVKDVMKAVSENAATSTELIKDIATKEGVKEEDVENIINAEIPVAADAEEHVEQTIALPATTSIEDYEEVKDMWIKQYEEGEVPVTENIQSREEWVEQDVVVITNTLNKLMSVDEKVRQQGLDELGFILPIFMINNLKGDELLVYLKAKLEGAKAVQKDLAKEKKLKEKFEAEKQKQEDDEELVDIAKPKEEEKHMEMELDEDQKDKTIEEIGNRVEDVEAEATKPIEPSTDEVTPTMDIPEEKTITPQPSFDNVPEYDEDPLEKLKSKLEEKSES